MIIIFGGCMWDETRHMDTISNATCEIWHLVRSLPYRKWMLYAFRAVIICNYNCENIYSCLTSWISTDICRNQSWTANAVTYTLIPKHDSSCPTCIFTSENGICSVEQKMSTFALPCKLLQWTLFCLDKAWKLHKKYSNVLLGIFVNLETQEYMAICKPTLLKALKKTCDQIPSV